LRGRPGHRRSRSGGDPAAVPTVARVGSGV
jgi:hypothetical protein